MNHLFTKILITISTLAETSSRKRKAEICRLLDPETRAMLVRVLEYVHHPYMNYYQHQITEEEIKEFEQRSSDRWVWSADLFDALFFLLNRLNDDEMRGKVGLNLCCMYLLEFPHAHDFLNLVLKGDLGLGLKGKSLRMIFPEFNLPRFSIQKCNTYGGGLLSGKYVCEPKEDGLRMILRTVDNQWTALSLKGRPLYNCEEIFAELELAGVPKHYVFDGEAFCEDWNLSVSITKTQKVHPERYRLKMKVWDCISASEWDRGPFITPLGTRRSLLTGICGFYRLHKLITTFDEHVIVDMDLLSADEQRQRMLLIRDHFVALGYEGSVIKDLSKPYIFGRHSYWLKYKPIETYEYIIVGVLEGKGRLANTCGKIILDVNGKRVRCGSGMDDSVRKYIWEHQTQLIGSYAEIKFQQQSKSGSLRFPIFIRLREDKL